MKSPATNKEEVTTEKTDQQQEQQAKLAMAKYVCQVKSIQVVMLSGDVSHWKEGDNLKTSLDLDTMRGHILQPLDVDISVDLSLVPSGKFK